MTEQKTTLAFSALIQKMEQEAGYDIQKISDDQISLDWSSLATRWGAIMNQSKNRLNNHIETFRQLKNL